MSLIYSLDLIGTFVFAISGAITASSKKLDMFGATVIAFVTALGGGTTRDVLIGSQPVGWMKDTNYLYIVVLAVISTYLFKAYIARLRKTMFLFDTIGIGLFTILGLQKALGMGLSPSVAIIMGVVSAVFGGVVRDVLSNEVPLIFRKEIYATACLAGALLFLGLGYTPLNESIRIIITVAFIIIIRVLAIKRHWYLPGIPE